MQEYDRIALDMARKGLRGVDGDPLPEGISGEVYWFIFEDQEAFQKRIRESAYMLAMGGAD